jgi:hypothetical protein
VIDWIAKEKIHGKRKKRKIFGDCRLRDGPGGGGWFGLAATGDSLQGMVKMFGFPLGAGLALGGLVMAGVYFWRWRRIQDLTSGKNLLIHWNDGIREVFIAPNYAYIDRELCLWAGAGARLEQVTLIEKKSYDSISTYLEIDYANSAQSRDLITGGRTTVWKTRQLSVRIPPEQIAEIQKVVEKLQRKIIA